jgi:hypothetical protein
MDTSSFSIEFLNQDIIQLRSPRGTNVVKLDLVTAQAIPTEFSTGEAVTVINHAPDPAIAGTGADDGWYEIKHIASGKTLRAKHQVAQC